MNKNTSKKPLNLILLGDPASGKVTQAARLVAKYHFYDFDMGRELRKPAVRARYDFVRTNAAGKLTPTWLVRDIYLRTIPAVPRKQGILFDGTPKMIGEAKLVARLLKQNGRSDPLVLYLSVPRSETVKRARKRREYVRGKLVKRSDDEERAIRNRWRYYEAQVSRVKAFFKKKYTFKKISGMGTRAEVWARIAAALRRYDS
ncbi:MAG: nucleoside monophosphate kinase [Minisyncoccia bacterium]|jgi:adenylate kinase family enzyme